MTKRTLVLIPVLALALVFIGCAGDHSGSGNKARNAFDSLDSDPIAEGLARGYVSTLVSDWSGNASYQSQASQVGMGVEPITRSVFVTPSVQGKAAPGQVGASTLIPARPVDLELRYDPTKISAKSGSNGSIVLTTGNQTAVIHTVNQGGKDLTFTSGMDGVVTRTGEDHFPKVVDEAGVGRGVVLVSGSVVMVQE